MYGGGGRGEGLCGLGICIGALKWGTLHKLGTTWLVPSVIFAVTCSSLRDSLGLRGAMWLRRKGQGGAVTILSFSYITCPSPRFHLFAPFSRTPSA